MAPYFADRADRADWPALEQRAASQIGGRDLDVGCGAGRHARPLTRRGLDVLGINALVGSADALPAGIGAFDTILLFDVNIGLLASRDHAPDVLAKLARVSTPNGRILAPGFDPHHTDADEHLDYQKRNRARKKLPGQVRMRIHHAHLATGFFDYLLCSPSELADLLDGSPWQLSDICHDDRSHNYLATMTRTEG